MDRPRVGAALSSVASVIRRRHRVHKKRQIHDGRAARRPGAQDTRDITQRQGLCPVGIPARCSLLGPGGRDLSRGLKTP